MLSRWNDASWLTPWSGDPLHDIGPFGELRRHMDRMLDELDRRFFAPEGGAPRFSLEDTGDALEVRADVPGFRREDIDVQIERNTVTIRARRETEVPPGYVAHRRERSSYEIARAFTLPCRVDPEKASATLKDGVLVLTLPKIAAEQPRRIEVKVG
ncbi:MAG TPA: Hsp20/alpha crystallin family protein [Sandaracinaceae bacterium]